MTVADWYRFFTWLALVAQAALAVAVVTVVVAPVDGRVREFRDRWRAHLADQGLALAGHAGYPFLVALDADGRVIERRSGQQSDGAFAELIGRLQSRE